MHNHRKESCRGVIDKSVWHCIIPLNIHIVSIECGLSNKSRLMVGVQFLLFSLESIMITFLKKSAYIDLN